MDVTSENYSRLERVPNGHPDQCETIRQGLGIQCNFKKVEGRRTCIMHGGNLGDAPARVKSLNSYRLGKYQKRMEDFAGASNLRSVDEEIGILRMVLEEVFLQCESDVDLLLYSQKIGDLVRDITKCVQVADKLATKSGMLIGRVEAMAIAEKVVNILPKYISDETILLKIAEELADAFLTKVEGSDGSNLKAINDARS
jgi:hypothetical protein